VTWSEREQQWQRFADWEVERLRSAPHDFQAALQWYSDAWVLARRLDPEWGSPARAEEHWRHLAEIRAALSGLRPRG